MIEKKKIIIVGLGIGSVYRDALAKYSDTYNILTIDSDPKKKAKYPSCDGFRYIRDKNYAEMTIICTPNYLHEEQIRHFAPISKVILVEKPGVESSKKWEELCLKFPETKIIMVKNNMYRDDIQSLKAINYFKTKDIIHLKWYNHNRIPFPGFWFTNKKLAFGGVSHDLLPHLLHFMFLISGTNNYEVEFGYKKQIYKMNDIKSTDYGVINKKNPIYNVDDKAYLKVKSGNKTFIIKICWKYSGKDEQTISYKDEYVWDFGLCPSIAYKNMVDNILLGNDKIDHFKTDMSVLKIIESLEEL